MSEENTKPGTDQIPEAGDQQTTETQEDGQHLNEGGQDDSTQKDDTQSEGGEESKEGQDTEKKPRHIQKRESVTESISERIKRQRAGEEVGSEEEGAGPADETTGEGGLNVPGSQKDIEDQKNQETNDSSTEGGNDEIPEMPEKFKIKFKGQEVVMSRDEYLQHAQLDVANADKIAELAATKAELKRIQDEIARTKAGSEAEPGDDQTGQDDKTQKEPLKIDRKKLSETISTGTTEEIDEAINQLLDYVDQSKSEPENTEELISKTEAERIYNQKQAEDRAMADANTGVETALVGWKKDFEDVANSNILVDTFTRQLQPEVIKDLKNVGWTDAELSQLPGSDLLVLHQYNWANPANQKVMRPLGDCMKVAGEQTRELAKKEGFKGGTPASDPKNQPPSSSDKSKRKEKLPPAPAKNNVPPEDQPNDNQTAEEKRKASRRAYIAKNRHRSRGSISRS